MEKVSDKGSWGQPELFLPYMAVFRKNSEITKLRIVYDAFHKRNRKSLSLNDCLKTGPALGPAKEHPDQKII